VFAFVVLALVLAVLMVAVVVVVVRELLRTVGKLTAQLHATNQRLAPLTEELQSELAVTAVEIEGLTKQVSELQAPNIPTKQRAPRRRSRRRR
jgi:predicted PurR-regulated permease PerM